jgi:predicted permease
VTLPRFGLSLLDLRLGIRMLTRYPVLTLISAVSLAFAIAVGAAAFASITLFLWPRLPLPDGDQIVALRTHDQASNRPESRLTADFLRMRAGTGTMADVAGGRHRQRNLRMGDGVVEPISVEEVTASMFPMVRVAPIMGRVLTDDDASAGAPPVMVLGERIWRERFAADPGIIGQALLLSDTPTTVVGVMPAWFRFPSVFEVWQPLRIDEAVAPRAGIGFDIWARMKPGVTREQANSELAVINARAAADWPATHQHLTTMVESPAVSDVNDPEERALLASFNLPIGLIVLVVSGNVALLLFARAATRESEILVRTALGASRARLVAQFFAEALVLSAVAGAAGLALAQIAMRWGVTTFAIAANDGEVLPFWITPSLPPVSIAYGIALASCAALVTGILPALKMTRGLSARLRDTRAGGGGLKFGGVWTVLIVSQIAVTVAAPGMIYVLRNVTWRVAQREIGVPAQQYLTARLGRESDMTAARFEAAVRRVREDLADTPGVRVATIADKLPLKWNGWYRVEVEDVTNSPRRSSPEGASEGGPLYISTAAVEPSFFDAFEAPALAGRLLTPADDSGAPRVAVVNQAFVRRILGGRNAVGRRLRYTAGGYDGQRPPITTDSPWLEIVGVVRDLAMAEPDSPHVAGAYIPLSVRAVGAVQIAARVSGDVATAAKTLRAIAATADPTLRVSEVEPLDQANAPMIRTLSYVAGGFGALTLSTLVLALSGIYAVMSFAVSRRTREIGIRVALGSPSSQVMLAILRRPLVHLAFGVACGALLAFWIASVTGLTIGLGVGVVFYALVMLGVCLLACVVPARRVLKVDPIGALRAD